MINVSTIPILTDNYVFVIHNHERAIVVDPGEAKSVLAFLKTHHLKLEGIFLTHHHPDHTAGTKDLVEAQPCPVYCSRYDKNRVPYYTHLLKEKDRVSALGLDFEVMDVAGHTLGHIAYYTPSKQWLFSGDTLFSLGCGRLFEGSAEQMWKSLQKIKLLPKTTKIFFTHEYTLANLAFSKSVDTEIPWDRLEEELISRRAKGLATSPSTLDYELSYNIFLRADSAESFGRLRTAKDQF